VIDLFWLSQCSKAKAQDAIFYSYTKHINGFAANLDAEEAAEIASEPLPGRFVSLCSSRMSPINCLLSS
jgi:hypothetical protein